MTREHEITRQEAIEALKAYGIEGEDVYLIDLIPLVEIIWADGYIQRGELALLENFLTRHVERINRLAGCRMLTLERAKTFLSHFLKQRPDPYLLRLLTEFVAPVRLSSSDEELNTEIRDSLLSACLDIAAAEAVPHPNKVVDYFSREEKECFFGILEALEGRESNS